MSNIQLYICAYYAFNVHTCCWRSFSWLANILAFIDRNPLTSFLKYSINLQNKISYISHMSHLIGITTHPSIFSEFLFNLFRHITKFLRLLILCEYDGSTFSAVSKCSMDLLKLYDMAKVIPNAK